MGNIWQWQWNNEKRYDKHHECNVVKTDREGVRLGAALLMARNDTTEGTTRRLAQLPQTCRGTRSVRRLSEWSSPVRFFCRAVKRCMRRWQVCRSEPLPPRPHEHY